MNNYPHSSGRKVKECKFFPGPDLIKSFLRHSELTNKFVPNIKKSRANVNEEILRIYSTSYQNHTKCTTRQHIQL